MTQHFRNGIWRLDACNTSCRMERGPIPAGVPGNIEMASSDTGRKESLFYGMNAKPYRAFEYYDFRYEYEFDTEKGMPGRSAK